jgi:Ca2+-binding EF-hand superfamily protein
LKDSAGDEEAARWKREVIEWQRSQQEVQDAKAREKMLEEAVEVQRRDTANDSSRSADASFASALLRAAAQKKAEEQVPSFVQILEPLPPRSERVKGVRSFFDAFDVDGSGSIDREEFKAAASASAPASGAPRLSPMMRRCVATVLDDELFDRFDADGDGLLSRDEFQAGLSLELELECMYRACASDSQVRSGRSKLCVREEDARAYLDSDAGASEALGAALAPLMATLRSAGAEGVRFPTAKAFRCKFNHPLAILPDDVQKLVASVFRDVE